MSENIPQDNRQIQIEFAEAMGRLLENDDFKKIFQELYIDAYAITNVYNMWSYDDAGRRRFLEKTLARSHFSKFIEDTLEEGRQAMLSMREESEVGDDEEETDY